jgi:hypothetical protein
MKINRPRSRFFSKNCPSPGRIKEKNAPRVEFVGDSRVFSVVAMEKLFGRKV